MLPTTPSGSTDPARLRSTDVAEPGSDAGTVGAADRSAEPLHALIAMHAAASTADGPVAAVRMASHGTGTYPDTSVSRWVSAKV